MSSSGSTEVAPGGLHEALARPGDDLLRAEAHLAAADEAAELDLQARVALDVTQHGKQDGERHDPLMAVDEPRVGLPLLLSDHELAEEIAALARARPHGAGDVRQEPPYLLRLPRVSALEIGEVEMKCVRKQFFERYDANRNKLAHAQRPCLLLLLAAGGSGATRNGPPSDLSFLGRASPPAPVL